MIIDADANKPIFPQQLSRQEQARIHHREPSRVIPSAWLPCDSHHWTAAHRPLCDLCVIRPDNCSNTLVSSEFATDPRNFSKIVMTGHSILKRSRRKQTESGARFYPWIESLLLKPKHMFPDPDVYKFGSGPRYF